MKKIISTIIMLSIILVSFGVGVYADGLSVSIISPANGSIIPEGTLITVIAEANGAECVEVYVDEKLIETLYEAPYVCDIGNMPDGDITITVKASSGDLTVEDVSYITSQTALAYTGFNERNNIHELVGGNYITKVDAFNADETGKYMCLGATSVGGSPAVYINLDNMPTSGKVAFETRIMCDADTNDIDIKITSEATANRVFMHHEGANICYTNSSGRATGYLFEKNIWHKFTYVIDYTNNTYYIYQNDNLIWKWKDSGLVAPADFGAATRYEVRGAFADTTSRLYVDYLRVYNFTEKSPRILLDEKFDNVLPGARNNADYLGKFADSTGYGDSLVQGANFDIVQAPAGTGLEGKVMITKTNSSTQTIKGIDVSSFNILNSGFDFYTTVAGGTGQLHLPALYADYQGKKLQSYGNMILFDVATKQIKYLTGGGYVSTALTWAPNTKYHLDVTFNNNSKEISYYITGGVYTEKTAIAENVAYWGEFATNLKMRMSLSTKYDKVTEDSTTYLDNFRIEKLEDKDFKAVMFKASTGKILTSDHKAPNKDMQILISFNNDIESIANSDNIKLYKENSLVAAEGSYDSAKKIYTITPTGDLDANAVYRLEINTRPISETITFTTNSYDIDYGVPSFTTDETSVNAVFDIKCSEYIAKSQKVTAIICVYDSGKLVDIKTQKLTIDPGSKADVDLTAAYSTGNDVRVCIWESLESIKPLCIGKNME